GLFRGELLLGVAGLRRISAVMPDGQCVLGFQRSERGQQLLLGCAKYTPPEEPSSSVNGLSVTRYRRPAATQDQHIPKYLRMTLERELGNIQRRLAGRP